MDYFVCPFGISAESGISTFRDSDGLWESHDTNKVASPEGWETDQELVLHFYNERRRQLKEVKPNAAHYFLKELEEKYNVVIITQNVDDLHERAGSSNIIHLHGELLKVKSEKNDTLIYDWTEDLHIGELAEDGAQLRSDIVWFGEAVPMLQKATEEVLNADIMWVIGTSMQVYPAAGLIDYMEYGKAIYVIDPKVVSVPNNPHIKIIQKNATEGVKELKL